MKKIVILLVFLSGSILAQTDKKQSDGVAASGADYYESAYKLYGTALRLALHNIIKNHTVVSYSSLWTHFQTTDKKPNGKVWDMYSDIPNGTLPYEFTFSTDQCGTYSVEGDCYNREHSWPKSWFNNLTPMESDMFHLFPTDGKVNGMRSNYNYGNVGTASWVSKNGSKLGQSIVPGFSGIVFEPITAYKGDLARGHFYMSVRYYTEDAGWDTSDGTNKSELLPWYANLLYSWHMLDTVSAKEVNRNEAIFGIQKNRNPFIDHPEFAAEIWNTAATPVVVSLNGATASIVIDFSRYLDSASAVTKENFVIDNAVGNPVDIQWGVDNDVSKLLLTTASLTPGVTYELQIKNLKSINNVAMNDTTISFVAAGTTNVGTEQRIPASFMLHQNYPNPFNPATTIAYEIDHSTFVTLKIFDLLGREVAVLANEMKSSGKYEAVFTAAEEPSGIYFYRFTAGNYSATKKMILQK